jgi:hypothetical protein
VLEILVMENGMPTLFVLLVLVQRAQFKRCEFGEHLEVNTGITTGDLRITSCTASNIYSVGVTAGTLRVTNSVTAPSIVATTGITTANLNSTMYRGIQYGKTGSTNGTANAQLTAGEVLSGFIHYYPYTGGGGTTLKLPNGSTLYAGTGVTVGSMIQCVIRYASGIGSGYLNITSGDSGSTLVHNSKNGGIVEGGGVWLMLTFFVLSSTEYIRFLND